MKHVQTHRKFARLADILLYSLLGGSHYCVDRFGVSLTRGGWRDAYFALASDESSKREKYARTFRSHGFDFTPLRFSPLGS